MAATDAELIEQFKKGDMNAAEILLRRYERPLLGFLVNLLHQQQDAEDALQETFLKALRGLKNYREENHFKSWLYRIAHREGLMLIRKRGKNQTRETTIESAQETVETNDTPIPIRIVEAERLATLKSNIKHLSDAERTIVWARIKSGLTFREIAETIDTPLNTVLSRMRNATLKLRKLMLEEAS